MRSRLLLATLGLLPAALVAQDPTVSRPGLTRLNWHLANAIVFSDSVSGAQLAVAATQEATKSDLEFHARFEPSAVDVWAAHLGAVLNEAGPPPDGAAYLMATLRGVDGGQVIVARTRDRKQWSKDVFVNFRPDRRDGFAVKLTRSEVERFGTALMVAAGESAVRPVSAGDPEAVRVGPDDVTTPLRILEAPTPSYPVTLVHQRVAGEVWTTFRVDTTGRAMPGTLEILLADHRDFAKAVRDALPHGRYAPATVNGRPVPTHVWQRFVFALHR